MKIDREILMTIVKNSNNRLEGKQEILEINEQQLHLINKELNKLFSLYGVVKPLKDKEAISFEEYVDKYYKRKDFKYFNKKGKGFSSTQIVTIYDEHINNL
tara:strand:+ start:59 stop:361 length:303 start_codon:yes stop_codon:yes gene_type:complete